MREKWARAVALFTGALVMLLAAAFAHLQSPVKTPELAESKKQAMLIEPVSLDHKRIAAGRVVYKQQTCARCHSIAGGGNRRNPLDGVGERRSAMELRNWIVGAEVLRGELPARAFKLKQAYGELPAGDLDALVIYMQSLRRKSKQVAKAIPHDKPAPVVPTGENGKCLTCHSNAGHLMQVVKAPTASSEDGCAAAPDRPAFLNQFVNAKFTQSVHGKFGCTACHGGNAKSEDKTLAHAELKPAEANCANCHGEISKRHATSLHKTLGGMAHALRLRSGEENFHKLGAVWNKDCASCHASCSDCHLTLPKAVGGGLLRGHEFFKRPPMKDTCAVCHGTRAGAEYLGKWPGVEPDVHFKAGMHCLDCHKNDLHGDGQTYTNRWQVKGRAQCSDCHAALPNKTAKAHDIKHANVSCQVCHSQPYQNCFGCHGAEKDGKYVRSTTKKGLDFKIGRNTAPEYPHKIVTLRNNPITRDSFAHFGKNLLPNFDAHPTWKTAAPHNIVRVPSQSRSCDSCHGNSKLFLAKKDLDLKGSKANQNVVIPNVPAVVGDE